MSAGLAVLGGLAVVPLPVSQRGGCSRMSANRWCVAKLAKPDKVAADPGATVSRATPCPAAKPAKPANELARSGVAIAALGTPRKAYGSNALKAAIMVIPG